MSWTHAICRMCWNRRNPEAKVKAIEFEDNEPVACCFCGRLTAAGIYVRHDPVDPALRCKGGHDDE